MDGERQRRHRGQCLPSLGHCGVGGTMRHRRVLPARPQRIPRRRPGSSRTPAVVDHRPGGSTRCDVWGQHRILDWASARPHQAFQRWTETAEDRRLGHSPVAGARAAVHPGRPIHPWRTCHRQRHGGGHSLFLSRLPPHRRVGRGPVGWICHWDWCRCGKFPGQ